MGKHSSKPKSDYAIQTVMNALRLLEVFDGAVAIGVSDVARSLGLHKNNAFRLLATLEIAGYVEQYSDNELYHLGPRCLELAHAFSRNHPFASLARPVLEALVEETGETAHVGVLRERAVSHLDGVVPSRIVVTGSRVGERLPAHCTALGKALLIEQLERPAPPPAPRAERIERARAAAAAPAHGLEQTSLERFTEATITDGAKLLDEIRAGQLRGYAVDAEEYAGGLHCVAAPVRDAAGRVVAALSLSGPSQRLSREMMHAEAAHAVVAAAERLSRSLGAHAAGTRVLGGPPPVAG